MNVYLVYCKSEWAFTAAGFLASLFCPEILVLCRTVTSMRRKYICGKKNWATNVCSWMWYNTKLNGFIRTQCVPVGSVIRKIWMINHVLISCYCILESIYLNVVFKYIKFKQAFSLLMTFLWVVCHMFSLKSVERKSVHLTVTPDNSCTCAS